MHTLLPLTALLCCTWATAGPQEACDYSAQFHGVTCVVLADGAVVHERYRRAGDESVHWRLASGTKSFSGVAAAAAVQDKLLTLDDKVSDTLTEWQVDGRQDITIRQVLGLISGITTPPPLTAGSRVTPAEAVQQPLAHPPGSRFAYGQLPFQLFAELMTRKLRGESYEAYLYRRVLQPLGIQLRFPRQPQNAGTAPDWGGGGAMTARDWATFGEWVRNGGQWNGHPLVDAAALADNFKGSTAHPGYGLTWWLRLPPDTSAPQDATTQRATDLYQPQAATALPQGPLWMAAGLGKQRLYILPGHKLVAVRQTESLLAGERAGFSDVTFLKLLVQ